MIDDYIPIIFNAPKEYEQIEIYCIHDIHRGNSQYNDKRWQLLKKEILSQPNRFIIFVGDIMENAIPGSKSDVFSQELTPQQQKDWFTEQLEELKERVVCVVDGNHERNRTTKIAGLFPLYDCCQIAGIKERYRPRFSIVDIGVGSRDSNKQWHYSGYIVHKAKDLKSYSSVDFIDGVDFMFYGHDHQPKDIPRAKMVYDSKNKTISIKSVETINSGSFLTYGGYAVDGGYRPNSDKLYKLILNSGREKQIQSIGFYL